MMNVFRPFALVLLFIAMPLSVHGSVSGCTYHSFSRHVKVSGDKRIVTDSVEMIITDRRGETYTSFEFQYSKGDRFTVNYAYISDMSGMVVRKLKGGDIKQRQYIPDATLYQDEFIKYFDLRHNSYPYKVSYSVTRVFQRFVHIGGIDISGKCDIVNGSYTVEVPAGYPLKYHARNLAEPVRENSERTDKYKWTYGYKYRKRETNQAPVANDAPYLTVVPERFRFGVPGSFDSWESFGRWSWELNKGLRVLPESEKLRIDALLDGVTDDREKVRILYHYLQDYNRYINVKIDLGGLKSYPAEYVCRNRFGDCKALCNYMQAMLEYAGIEAHYTLAYLDRQIPYFTEDFPNDAFNHIIVVVPLENETVFLECTSKNNPFNYPGTQNQGRKALVTKQHGSHLTDVPAMTPADTECVYSFTVRCPNERNSSIRLDAVLRGEDFERFAFLANGISKNDAEFYLRNYEFGSTLDLTDYDIDRPHRDSTFLNLRIEGRNPGFYRTFGQTMILDNISLGIPAYESPADRKYAVQTDFPRNDRMTISYELDGIEPAALPPDVEIDSPYGSYRLTFGKADGRITVTKRLEINSGTVPIDEYPAFYDFVSRVRSSEYSKFQIPIL